MFPLDSKLLCICLCLESTSFWQQLHGKDAQSTGKPQAEREGTIVIPLLLCKKNTQICKQLSVVYIKVKPSGKNNISYNEIFA